MLIDVLTHRGFCSLNSYSKSNFNIVKSFRDGSQNLVEKTAQDYNLNSHIFWDLISECLWGGESLHPFPTSRRSYITSAFAPESHHPDLWWRLAPITAFSFLKGQDGVNISWWTAHGRALLHLMTPRVSNSFASDTKWLQYWPRHTSSLSNSSLTFAKQKCLIPMTWRQRFGSWLCPLFLTLKHFSIFIKT